MQSRKPQKRARAKTRAIVILGIKSCWWRQKQEDLWGATETSYIDSPCCCISCEVPTCSNAADRNLSLMQRFSFAHAWFYLQEVLGDTGSYTQLNTTKQVYKISLTHNTLNLSRSPCPPMLLWNNHALQCSLPCKTRKGLFQGKVDFDFFFFETEFV